MRALSSETSIDSPGSQAAVALPLPQEEQARADLYGLIAHLLLAPPDGSLRDSLAGADAIVPADAGHPLDRAWTNLSLAARLIPLDAMSDEFHELFTSTSIPRLNPYGSLYLAGFLNEKPLAGLRTDLARLGLARRPGVAETEDHLGALCETMRRMIAGGQGVLRQPLAQQQAFFETHLAPWYGNCLDELRNAEGANFYVRVAELAAAFFAVEREAFEVAAE